MLTMDDFLARCREAVLEPSPTLAVQEVVQRLLRDRAQVAGVFGPPSRAKIDILHASDEVVVLHVVWAPAMRFPPHDHRTWAVIGIYGGDEHNAFYRRDGVGIVPAGGHRYGQGEAIVLEPEVIHAVTNPRTHAFTGAIHVYGGPYLTAPRSMWEEPSLTECPATFEASQRIFEEANRSLSALSPDPPPT